MRHIFFLFLIIFIGCDKSKDEDSHILAFNRFTIEVPKTWSKNYIQGIEYNRDVIITGKGDTMIVYFGKDVPSFNEIVKVYSFRDKAHFDSINWEVEGLIFSEQPVIDEGQGVYLKEYYMLDTVDDVPVKYKIPKIIGRG